MASARSKTLKKIIKESYPVEKFTVNLSNDPVVLAKKEKAEKLLSKYPVPESFLNKPKAKNKKTKVKKTKSKA
jgi:hypothetical protein